MRLIDADALIRRINKNDDLPWNLDAITQIVTSCIIAHAPTVTDEELIREYKARKLFAELFGDENADDKSSIQ